MNHQMSLQTNYFNYIKNGTKRIELRLFDEKRQKINLGDAITFTDPSGNTLQTEVTALLRYNTFEELFNDFDISILADASMTRDDLLSELTKFYPEEAQASLGVLGIKLKLL